MPRKIKIRCTSKTYPKVDPKEIAEALGAETIFSEKVNKDGFFIEILEISLPDKKEVRKRIYRLKKDELAEHSLIGKAEGMNLWHCIYLASKYSENFRERVVGYCVDKPSSAKFSIAVSFYEKKSS